MRSDNTATLAVFLAGVKDRCVSLLVGEVEIARNDGGSLSVAVVTGSAPVWVPVMESRAVEVIEGWTKGGAKLAVTVLEVANA